MRTSNIERPTSNVEVKAKRRSAIPWLPAVALFVLAVVTYIPSMTNGFIWDDPQYVVDNPSLKSADGLWRIWTDPTATPQYYPMVHTTFWIESQFPGGTDHASKFHVDNILLHALAAVLLWRALVSLEVPGAWLAAAIFAVHPVMVESVTWITERKNVLSIVFYLLAFHAYRRSGLMDYTPFKRRWYIASLILFLLALLSKTVTCSLPAAILLIIWWERQKRGHKPFRGIPSGKKAYDPFSAAVRWRDVKPLVPMLILGLALSGVTSHLEHTRVGARGPDFDWSIVDRCLIAGHAICFYFLKIVWPHPLMFMYPRWDLHANRAIQFGYPAIVIWLVATLWLARQWIGRGPLVAVLFFIGTLVPALGFVNVYPMRYSFVADHFQYLASVGIIVLIAVGLHRVSKYSVVLVMPLAWITWHQQSIYKDAKTLWENTIAQNETSWMAHVNRAGVFRADKQFDAAMQETRRALELAPNEADTHNDFGRDLALHSQWEAAIEQFKLAAQRDPEHAQIWGNLSELLWDHTGTPQGQAEAVTAARRALSLQQDVAEAHYVMARYAELRGDLRAAIDEYNKAVAINNDDYQSHYNLGNCLLETGNPGPAAGEYQKVLRHDPNDAVARTNLGYAYLYVGKRNEAAEAFQQALSLKPDLAAAREGLKKTQSQ